MNQYVVFVTNHWALCSLFVAILLALIINEAIAGRLGASQVAPETAVLLMNHQHAVVLDARSESSFAEGHIIGAHHLSMQTLTKKIGSLQKYKNKPIILVSAGDKETSKISQALKQDGFQVLVLHGGIPAWKVAGLPLVRS